MSQYNERLEELRQQIARKNRLQFILKDLKAQQKELSDKVYELGRCKIKEQDDVDKLEGRSLAAFFYNVVGKKAEMLDKETQEAYAARVKYDAALAELQAVEAEIQRAESEYRSIQWAEQRYHQTLQEKAKAIRTAGFAEAVDIMRLEEELAKMEIQKKELKEAISAGEYARDLAGKVLSSLDSAKSWGTWDLVGGGVISDLAKHSHLDDAQNAVERLQIQLRRFKTELADVAVEAEMKVNIDGFLRFADYFFDGLFADWTVLDKISQSQSQVQQTRSRINDVLSQLNKMMATAEQERSVTRAKLDELILKVDM